MSVICPACTAINRDGARHCKSCGGTLGALPLPLPVPAPAEAAVEAPVQEPVPPPAAAPAPAPAPAPAVFPGAQQPSAGLQPDAPLSVEDLEETLPARRPTALYAGVAVAGVALVGALAWWLLRDAPAAASVPVAAPAEATAPTVARTPDEDIITEAAEPAGPAPAEPAVALVPDPAVAAAPSAVASAPARPAPPRPRPAPGDSNDPPWQHPGSRAPAPASLSGPAAATTPAAAPVAAAPLPPPDPLAPLRADLRQCDGEAHMLGKGMCVVRVRHRHCGNHWGKVPECPLGQRNDELHNN